MSIGCTEVAFIPEGRSKTADLKATLVSDTVLCEVKTINSSDGEIDARNEFSVRGIVLHLGSGFFSKLGRDLQLAKAQTDAYCSGIASKKIAYVIANFDDIVHEYSEGYLRQIRGHLEANPLPGLEIIFDVKPPWYAATA